ncbi:MULTISPECIES: ImmA/IrrE family metallo-endopeptidase [unclassified Paenibacillus]|uniref:ImmA/IrrE family metallo-endopeptidase n=1 Tax=unclassified Paenibacillus TaxID=185978 RepID=UPI0030F6775E
MFKYYKETHLEEFVKHLYIKNGIHLPGDIAVSAIAKKLNVTVTYVKVRSTSHQTKKGKLLIFLNDQKTLQEQREDFLHELGHLLRHSGNQNLLPKSFVKYQEDDTEQFKIYALMPFFMINQIILSPDRRQAIEQLSIVFSVNLELAQKRYEQILRREFEGGMNAEISNAIQPRKEVNTTVNDEVEFAVYYDPSGTTDGPSQLIVTLDEWTLINCREIELPIGERLPEIDLDEMQRIECMSTFSSDVICFDGILTLQVHQLLYRHGLKKRCYVIHMHDVDMKIARDQIMTRKLSW